MAVLVGGLIVQANGQEERPESRTSLLGGLTGLSQYQMGRGAAPITITTEGPGGLRVLGEQQVVADKRTRITYLDYAVEADRAVLDWRTQEVKAEGNVTLKGPGVDIRANAVRYNFRLDEGVAYGMEGHHEQFFFRVQRDETEEGAAFRRISKNEALIQDVGFTACDFPVPHYYIRGSEVILILGERIFVRNAVLYVRGLPVFYLPAYTRSLITPSPWSFEGGYSDVLGAYLRIGYDYYHRVEEPDYFNPSKYRTRSRGQARVNFDTFTQRGVGLGLKYDYSYEYDRHKGSLFAYGIRDRDRDALDEEDPPDRGAFRLSHRSRLSDSFLLQLDIEEHTDPDLYYEILDRFSTEDLGRRPERRTRASLTYARETYLARIMLDLRDRVTRDYYRDPSEPTANNLDYDPDPEGIEDDNVDGISGRRYGTVSRKLPRVDLSTAHIKLWELPLYYDTDVHAFHALDKGLNPLNDEDDAWVDGADWHQALMHRLRLADRYTWLNRAGLGLAYFDRQDETLGAELPDFVVFPYQLDGLTLVDRDTWLTGERERSYRDVDNGHLYYDIESRLNARFTNTLEGYAKYTYRNGTDDSLGEFYRRTGQRTAQTDIYEFPVRRNMLEGFLNYFLLYPNLSLYFRGGLNLHSESDIAPYDILNYVGTGGSYSNDTRELTVSAGVDLREQQIRDLSDPNQFEQSSLVYSGQIQYVPRHQRWWARLGIFAVQMLDNDPLSAPQNERDRFDENRTEVSVSPLVGRRLGPKYTAEVAATYNTQYDDWKSAHVILKRDLHDLEAAVLAGFRRVEEVNDGQAEIKRENEIRFSVRLKLPATASEAGPTGSIQTLADQQLQTEFVD